MNFAPDGTFVDVQGLTVHFPVRSGLTGRATKFVRAVDGVSFGIGRGETLGLVGESGCGKSTTGRALLRLQIPTSGTVSFDGIDLGELRSQEMRAMRRRMQMIFQDPFASLNPRMKVGDLVVEPLEVHRIGTDASRRARVRELLEVVGLRQSAADRYPHQFSGGQRQRIGIARALAIEPEFVMCDEPISALDVSIQAQILNLLEDLRADFHLTYLFIAHDLSVVRHICDRVAVMYLGRIVEYGSRSQVFSNPAHPYTIALLSAVPVPDPAMERKRRRIILRGDLPSPVDPPDGCRFHTRCWLYEQMGRPAICREVDPQAVELEAEHTSACHFAKETSGSRSA